MEKKREILASIGVIMALIAVLVFPAKGSADQSQSVNGPVSSVAWPHLYGQVGSYWAMNVTEVANLSAAGFHMLLVTPNIAKGAFLTAMQQNNVKYIDPFIWNTISATFSVQVQSGKPWTMTDDQEQTVLTAVKAYLATQTSNTQTIGYWVLDDSPRGDIRDLIEKIHVLVAASNSTTPFPKPVICGFGGVLDEKTSSTAPFVANSGSFQLAVQNFTPAGCDMVALYPYAVNQFNDPTLVDWSMSALLPMELQALRDMGWDQSREPLIGMPHTFSFQKLSFGHYYYVLPRAQDIKLQSEAYCKAGAVALLAYTWDDNYAATPRTELFNSPDMVQGLQQGMQVCQSQYWTQPADTVPPVITLKGNNPLNLHVGDTFNDPGATASDAFDGDDSGSIAVSGSVDTNTIGTYTLTYTVRDVAGNSSSVTRSVSVSAAPAVETPSAPAPVIDTPAPVVDTTVSEPVNNNSSGVSVRIDAPAPEPIISSIAPLPASSAPAVGTGFWSFIPFIKKAAPKAPVSLTPVLPTPRAQVGSKKDYTIAQVVYTLNGTVVHTATAFPDNWQLDTTGLSDGTYTLVSTLQYADGATESSTNTFTVDNTPNIFQKIVAAIQGAWKKYIQS